MNEELTQESVDSAIILEGKMHQRVRTEVAKVLEGMLDRLVTAEVAKVYALHKETMLMEIAITVGKTLRTSEAEYRKPLWESTPEELGLNPADLNKHMLGKDIDDHAVRK